MNLKNLLRDVADATIPSRRRERQREDYAVHETLNNFEQLSWLPMENCDASALRKFSKGDVDSWIRSPEIDKEWESIAQQDGLDFPEMTGGCNPGDRRAIYYLVRSLKPKRILEVGTHIGCSTVHIALAVKKLRELGTDTNFLSVDVKDVNDPVAKPWLVSRAKHSPAELVEMLGCRDLVQFQTSKSVDFLRTCEDKFDFIFLDGDHAATTVYHEVPAALTCLAENGVILLHDYFPDTKPLWSDGAVIPGVTLGIRRLQQEGAPLAVIPLGALPWPTKLGSNVTSLALLMRS